MWSVHLAFLACRLQESWNSYTVDPKWVSQEKKRQKERQNLYSSSNLTFRLPHVTSTIFHCWASFKHLPSSKVMWLYCLIRGRTCKTRIIRGQIMWPFWENIGQYKSLSRIQLFATPWTISPWNSPGQNTGVGSLSLLWGIFPTQGSNPGLPYCRWILYQLR